MSDIVERLRKVMNIQDCAAAHHEAADEIERLRSAIDKQIERHDQWCVCPCCSAALGWTTTETN